MKKLFTGLSSSVVIGISCIMLLSACSSSPDPDSNYYLFSQPTANNTNMAQTNEVQVKAKQYARLTLTVAQYLNQPNIVLQKADQSLHYAPFDLWAMPLRNSISDAIVFDFNQQSKQTHLLSHINKSSSNIALSLNVNIEYFHVNSRSEIILSGVYQWYSNEDKQIKSIENFYFKSLLAQDGYPHVIEKMRSLISLLSQQIVKEAS